jgi:hypothetical protein
MVTGNLCRAKKFKLEINQHRARLYMCGRNQTIPEQLKEYPYGWKRRKQLVKALVVDMLSEHWMSNKDFIDFILGEGLIHKVELLALVSTFDRELYLKEKEEMNKK